MAQLRRCVQNATLYDMFTRIPLKRFSIVYLLCEQAKTTARNEDIDENDSDGLFISNNRAEGSTSSNFSRSPTEEADKQISSADETIEIKCDDLEDDSELSDKARRIFDYV